MYKYIWVYARTEQSWKLWPDHGLLTAYLIKHAFLCQWFEKERRALPFNLLNLYVLSTSFGKIFFAWCFILKENSFFLIDHVFSETVCLFYFYALFSNICCKINFYGQKMELMYVTSIVNQIFGIFYQTYFLLFCTVFKLLMFHNNIVKISESLNKLKLLKVCIKTTYPVDVLHIMQPFLYQEKKKVFDLIKTDD